MWFWFDLIGLNQNDKHLTNQFPNLWLDLIGLNQNERQWRLVIPNYT